MKKICSVMLAMVLCMQIALIKPIDVSASGIQTTSGSAMDLEFIGRLDSTIISVVMPTQVKFAVIPEAEGWNKMLSPDFSVRNAGNVMIDVSITKAELVTPNVSFTSEEPTFNNGMREVRMAIAPKSDYPSMFRVRDYILLDTISDANSIMLTSPLDYDPNNDSAVYNIYGDISSGWDNGEEFAVKAVFKVAAR